MTLNSRSRNHRSPIARFSSAALLAGALLLTGLTSNRARAEGQRDPKAVEITNAVKQAMGGPNAWDNIQFLRFGFKVTTPDGQTRADRHHLWDKWTGRYRFEEPTEDGKTRVVLCNMNTKQGDVYLDGQKVADGSVTEILDQAHGAFINDMYWLAMPWKWLDSGVNIKYNGEQEKDGVKYDVVELTFNSVGRTPGDMYHAFVAKDPRLMTYWEYTLQSDRTGAWTWEYGDHNGVKIASTHKSPDGAEINMGKVAILEKVEDAYFTDPGRMISSLP